MAGGRNAEGFSDLLMFRVNKLLSDDGYTAGSFAIGLKADEGVSAGVAKPGKASMATIMISSAADLVKAVTSATDGEVIHLAVGDYGPVSLTGVHSDKVSIVTRSEYQRVGKVFVSSVCSLDYVPSDLGLINS